MTIKYLDSNRISVISSSCLVHFTLDEASGNPTNHATTANGFPLGTGSTNNGTNGSSGATQNVTGKFDKCFEFGGGDNKQVNIGTVLSGTGDFSISLWINHSNNNSNYASVVSNYGGGNTSGYQFYMNGTGNTISFHTSGSAINGGTAMSASAWHHVVVTRTSGVLNLYVDGSSDATAVANTHSISTSLSDAIGGKSDGSSGFNGKIDEVSIWLRGISASEVSKLYNGGTGDTLLEAKGLGKWTMNPTYEDDFTTNKGWVSNDTAKMNVNTSTSVFDFTSIRNGSAATAYKTLSKTASNDKWLLRFRYNMSSSNNNDARLFIGLSSTTGNYGSTEDWLGIIIPSSSGHNLWAITDYNNAAVTIGSYSSFALTPATGTNYYVELIRVSSTSFKLNLYSDPAYSTLINSVTHTMLATVDGLSHLKIMNMDNDSAGYSMTGIIDDVSYYNGVSSV